MTLKEKIAELNELYRKVDFSIERKRHEIKTAIESKKGAYCGKCDSGYMRRPFASAEGMTMPEVLREGYPVLCECIGIGKADEELVALSEKHSEIESLIDKFTRMRFRLSDMLGSEYVDNGLHNYNREGNEKAIDLLIEWKKAGMRAPLMIVGPTGAGKTHILSGVINQLYIDFFDVFYIDGYKIDKISMMETYERDQLVQKMTRAGILIIDDIGKSKMTDALLSHVYFPILNTRRNNKRITIYTSDKMPRELWRAFPDRENVESLYTRIEWVIDDVPQITIVPLAPRGK